VARRFAVYLPPGFRSDGRHYPTLYLLRGHEDEWIGSQDGREGLRSLLDRLIRFGAVRPLVAVMPGFMPRHRRSQGIPVNWHGPGEAHGVGNARFEDHFLEVLAHVERRLPVIPSRRFRALDGFSMGGYSALLLAVRHPQLFASVGSYDGSFMWPGQSDPRRPFGRRRDRLWFSESCAPMFRRAGRWDVTHMEAHNPATIVATATGDRLARIRELRFHVRTVARERWGNVDRTRHMVRTLRASGIDNAYRGAALHPSSRARHTWKWADVHLAGNLLRHDAVFRGR